MRFLFLLLIPVYSFEITCYYITSFIRDNDVFMYPETEKRLHRACPSVSAHIVSGEVLYDGVVETLLNRVDGSPPCIEGKEEDKILQTIGLDCYTLKY